MAEAPRRAEVKRLMFSPCPCQRERCGTRFLHTERRLDDSLVEAGTMAVTATALLRPTDALFLEHPRFFPCFNPARRTNE